MQLSGNSARSAVALLFCAILGCALYVSFMDKKSNGPHELFASLFSWSNDADDGVSVLHGMQHGLTRIISACDADDPACTYHMAPDYNYQKSFWSGPSENAHEKVTVQIQNQHVMPSSIEDDLAEGPDSRLGKTDAAGRIFRRPNEYPTFTVENVKPHQGMTDLGDTHTGAVKVESRAGTAGNDRLFGPGPNPANTFDAWKPLDSAYQSPLSPPAAAEVVDRLGDLNRALQSEVQENIDVDAKLNELRKLAAQLSSAGEAQQRRIEGYIEEEKDILDKSRAKAVYPQASPSSQDEEEEEEQEPADEPAAAAAAGSEEAPAAEEPAAAPAEEEEEAGQDAPPAAAPAPESPQEEEEAAEAAEAAVNRFVNLVGRGK